MKQLRIRHVRGKVRAPFLNGKCERFFRTFRIWWRLVLCGRSAASVQRRINDYAFWYNNYRLHSALGVLTPNEAWDGQAGRNADTPVCDLRGQECPRYRPPRPPPPPGRTAPEPIPIRARDPQKFHIAVARQKCRGDLRLPVIQITVRKAACPPLATKDYSVENEPIAKARSKFAPTEDKHALLLIDHDLFTSYYHRQRPSFLVKLLSNPALQCAGPPQPQPCPRAAPQNREHQNVNIIAKP